jgi:hypothetical protein
VLYRTAQGRESFQMSQMSLHANQLKSSDEPLALLNTNADSYTLSSTSFFVEFGLGVTVVRKNIFEIASTIA